MYSKEINVTEKVDQKGYKVKRIDQKNKKKSFTTSFTITCMLRKMLRKTSF